MGASCVMNLEIARKRWAYTENGNVAVRVWWIKSAFTTSHNLRENVSPYPPNGAFDC
jgi:hypothetical protein